ncbi:MAG: SUMF1/EgtB/PvdO family nonheme iron enzyme [Xenococcaceae cyanobacterium]
MNTPPNKPDSKELLEKAAQCYIKAGWLDEAGRVWARLGKYSQAAHCYEQQETWSKAAQFYEKEQDLSKAAQCYLKADQPDAAVECWHQGGEPLRAAWIRADSLKQRYQPLAILAELTPKTETEALEIELITARCQASPRNNSQAAKSLRKLLDFQAGIGDKHLYEWGLRIAQVIKRPDLRALIYAAAVRAKIPNAIEEWEKWAIEKLGDATGIPDFEKEGALEVFEFETVKVNDSGEIIKRERRQAGYFSEQLGKGINIEMVYIRGGTFLMGSPEEEKDSYNDERPQHQVTVEPFFMGKYPVTQGQWRAIASLPKVDIDLELDPSHFKGDSRPVEQVNWYEAVEFCKRLSNATEREYRLPSEAEWEYACRAGTSTPFYFGETITGELANYRASNTYANESSGEDRGETTPVGQFPPNGFGLYDLHGNVDEWCADDCHDNYDGAPTDGSVWLDGNEDYSPVRGGSWRWQPQDCRSAYRVIGYWRVGRSLNLGFRVVCGSGRTQ